MSNALIALVDEDTIDHKAKEYPEIKLYKLVVHKSVDAPNKAVLIRTPFYNYSIEDYNGKQLGGFTKAVFTLDAQNNIFGKLTLHRTLLDESGNPVLNEDNTMKEEVITVDAEIEVR